MADYGGSAYGAAGAGTEFNPVEFIKRPDVILRIVGWVFAVIVFGCIADQGWYKVQNVSSCVYNDEDGACGFGTFVGVMAFLSLMGFLVLAALFNRLSNAQHRGYVLIAEIISSGIWTFMYFVSFCFLTNQWSKTGSKDTKHKSGAEAAIAFSFFSIFIFIALTVLAVRKYRLGVGETFQSDYTSDYQEPAPYAGSGSAYQGGGPAPPPFSAAESKPPVGGYQQPTY